MKVELSLSIYGTQAVVDTYNREGVNDVILPDHPKWPRYSAMARLIAREHNIKGLFVRADIQSYNHVTSTQFSYRDML